MTTTLPRYQEIEDAYKGVSEVIGRLPESNLTARAKANLDISQDLAYRAREGTKSDDPQRDGSGQGWD